MEKDTVTLSLKEYNNLRDFKEKIENGFTLYITNGIFYKEDKFITKDDSIKKISEANKLLTEEISKLESELAKKNPSLSEIRNMSVWQFLKWRKSYNQTND